MWPGGTVDVLVGTWKITLCHFVHRRVVEGGGKGTTRYVVHVDVYYVAAM